MDLVIVAAVCCPMHRMNWHCCCCYCCGCAKHCCYYRFGDNGGGGGAAAAGVVVDGMDYDNVVVVVDAGSDLAHL